MTECPVDDVTCDRCDYRLVRDIDPTARLVCQLCSNYEEGDHD